MTFNTFLGAAALTLVAGFGSAILPSAVVAQTAPAPAPATEAPAAETKAVVVPELVMGNPDAKVTLTEYASYTCPHCASFHSTVFKDLKRDYIDTGKVKFVYREVFFDRYGLWASMVARCGGEMRYFGIQDLIYSQQQEWASAGGPVDVVEALRKIGLSAGLTKEQLDVCMQDGDMAQALITKFETDSKADNVTSTPTLIVNGDKHSNMSYADLQKVLDAELAE